MAGRPRRYRVTQQHTTEKTWTVFAISEDDARDHAATNGPPEDADSREIDTSEYAVSLVPEDEE